MTRVPDFMTSNLIVAQPATPLSEAARLMRENDVGILPVVDGGRLAGVVTDRDIVVRVVAEGRTDANVGTIMSRQPITISPEDDEQRAESLMAEHGVRRLPVCEGSRPVGIVTVGDLAVRADEKSPER